MSGYCHSNGVLWDIGANMEIISAHFAHPKYMLKAIHAFEANPDMFAVFQPLFANHPIVKGHIFLMTLGPCTLVSHLHRDIT